MAFNTGFRNILFMLVILLPAASLFSQNSRAFDSLTKEIITANDDKSKIDASGGSDVSVNVKGELNMKAAGASNITYYGKPSKVTKSAYRTSEINCR